MITIYKFPLETIDEQKINIHKFFEPLTIQMQNNVPCLWAIIDTAQPIHKQLIKTYGTGHPIVGNPGKYLGTYQLLSMVFHVFDSYGGDDLLK